MQTWLVKQFTENLSRQLNTEVSIDKVKFSFFNKLHLENVLLRDQANDTLLYVHDLTAAIIHIGPIKKEINLQSIQLSNCALNSKLNADRESNFAFLFKNFKKKEPKNPFLWSINCQQFKLADVLLTHQSENEKKKQKIRLQDIQFDARHFALSPDSIYFEISDFKALQSDGFRIDNMSARFTSKQKVLKIVDFKLSTGKSHVSNLNLTIDQSELQTGEKISKAKAKLDLGVIDIGMSDFAYFLPVIQHPEGSFRFGGHFSGRLDSIHGRNISIKRGDKTNINCDIYVLGLPNFEQSTYNLTLRNSSLEFDDFNELMQSELIADNDFLSRIMKDVGVIRYDGSFKGSTSNFLAQGTFETNYGLVKGNLTFSPSEKNGITAQGRLLANDFQLGQLLQNEQLGSTDFKGRVQAELSNKKKFMQAKVEGKIDSLHFSNYCYRDISLNGLIKPKLFEGNIIINDKNLQLNFNGLANANEKNPNFAFRLRLGHTNLKKLNLMKSYQKAEAKLEVDANFSGADFTHLLGEISLPTGHFITEHDTLKIDGMRILSSMNPSKQLQLESEFINYQMNGHYNYADLPQTFKSIASRFLPNLVTCEQKKRTDSQFDFQLHLKNLQPIFQTFLPTLAIDSSLITGKVSEPKQEIFLDGEIGKILTPSFTVDKTQLAVSTEEEMNMTLKLHDIYFGKKETPFQLQVISSIATNQINNYLSWNTPANDRNSGSLRNQISFETDSLIQLKNYHSKFKLNDMTWQMSPSNITISKLKTIEINNFLINNSFQSLFINGVASDKENDSIQLKLTNIDLKDFNNLLPPAHQLEGTMNAKLDLHSVLANMRLVGGFSISDLIYNQEKLGRVDLHSNWSQLQKAVNMQLNIAQPQGNLHAEGYFKPEVDSLKLAVNANKISLNFLSPMLSGLFKNIRGYASGNLLFHGEKSKLLIDGDLLTSEARIALNALNVNYHFNDTIQFRQDSIIFDRIRIYDDEKHLGALQGSLKHTNFGNMDYNLSMNSLNLMLMNTTSADNEAFFGKAYGRGTVKVTGKDTKVNIRAIATTLANTDISFAPMGEEKAEAYNFLSFINNTPKTSTLQIKNPTANTETQSELDMKFNITATPDAKFQLVFNSKIGDVIQARGKGNMQVNIDKNFNIGMYGEIEASWGDYLFTLQNIFSKRFSIEKGSTIQWSGDPLAADLDIKAIYNLKAPLNDLVVDSYDGYDFSQRVPVNCYIILQDNLNNPNISFDIKFPTVEDRIQDELRQYMSTEEDINRQMISLLLMGNFYTPDYLQGTYTGLGTAFMGSTTSELLSNQLSNWLSAISDNFDLGVNYRPGNDITDDEVELALSTQLFNNRVTINGNISNNVNTTGTTNTNNNSAFVGDFDVLVALNKNGKLQLKAYNHSNNNIIYETSPYKQGVGFSYQEDFNTWQDLWRKFKNIFYKSPTEKRIREAERQAKKAKEG